MDKIHKIWNLEATITPVDVGLGYYVIRFESKANYFKVYHGGPWIVQDHYLTVRKWHGNFKTDMAMAAKTAIWVRLSMLPLEFYDEISLKKIATELEKPLKVDLNTIGRARGSYTRVCVEMDLSKPLEPSIAVDKYDILLEYEHIQQIFFSCGKVGHQREHCSSNQPMVPKNISGDLLQAVAKAAAANRKKVHFNGQVAQDVTGDIGFGDWKVVQRRKGRSFKLPAKLDPTTQRNNGPGFKHSRDPNRAGPSKAPILNPKPKGKKIMGKPKICLFQTHQLSL